MNSIEILSILDAYTNFRSFGDSDSVDQES